MTLNLHLLRIFGAVVDSGSFSGAARKLYISQPAVSQAVQELERQVGLSLLIRSGRSIRLTEAGRLLYDYTRQILATEHAAELALEQLRGLEHGQLAIGASSTIGVYLLPRLLSSFHQRYPGIRLRLDIGSTAQIVERLLTADLDTALVEGPVAHPHITTQFWRDDALVVIAMPTHPIAHEQPVALSRLLAEPFVCREPTSGTREIIDVVFQERGVAREIAIELGSTEAIKQAVMAGLGLAIVSVATVASELALGNLAVLHVPDLAIRRPLKQLTVIGRPASPALVAFQALLNDAGEPPHQT
ncbi:MAG: LysR family transcriptional regulator [Anaerolineae bacterium]|nr:LysR family transcriptional regulator [Anaerolineae bacterium]